LNLARSFKAGKEGARLTRRVATVELARIHSSLRDEKDHCPIPALKDRTKFKPTLRVEESQSEI
jgi:hypothetical protein